MSITMVHDFRLSFEQNAVLNCERFMEAGEPLRDDLLSQVQTVIRQNQIMVSQYEDEISESKAELENTLRSTYSHRVREWQGKRQAHYEAEIAPREAEIAALQEQNRRLQACLDFHNKETKRREKAERDRMIEQYPKRIEDLLKQAKGADKTLVQAVYVLAKLLDGKTLFQAVEGLVGIPQAIKRLLGDRLLLENQGITPDEMPEELLLASKEMDEFCAVVERIVGQKHPSHGPVRTTTAKALALSRAKEQKAEMEARRREGIN